MKKISTILFLFLAACGGGGGGGAASGASSLVQAGTFSFDSDRSTCDAESSLTLYTNEEDLTFKITDASDEAYLGLEGDYYTLTLDEYLGTDTGEESTVYFFQGPDPYTDCYATLCYDSEDTEGLVGTCEIDGDLQIDCDDECHIVYFMD